MSKKQRHKHIHTQAKHRLRRSLHGSDPAGRLEDRVSDKNRTQNMTCRSWVQVRSQGHSGGKDTSNEDPSRVCILALHLLA